MPQRALAAVPFLAVLLLFGALLGGCSSDPTGTTSTPPPGGVDGSGSLPVGGALPADVFPFTAFTASFMTSKGEARKVRLELTSTGARMTISAAGASLGYMDWRRDGSDILLSDGPDRWVAMLRVGAVPGTTWKSSGRVITFDGWERVATPAGEYDAVRITSASVTEDLEESETWWFAPGAGLVRLTQNKGDLFHTEMWRTR